MFWNPAPKAQVGQPVFGPGVKKTHVKAAIKARNSAVRALGVGATAVVKTKTKRSSRTVEIKHAPSVGGVGKGGHAQRSRVPSPSPVSAPKTKPVDRNRSNMITRVQQGRIGSISSQSGNARAKR